VTSGPHERPRACYSTAGLPPRSKKHGDATRRHLFRGSGSGRHPGSRSDHVCAGPTCPHHSNTARPAAPTCGRAAPTVTSTSVNCLVVAPSRLDTSHVRRAYNRGSVLPFIALGAPRSPCFFFFRRWRWRPVFLSL